MMTMGLGKDGQMRFQESLGVMEVPGHSTVWFNCCGLDLDGSNLDLDLRLHFVCLMRMGVVVSIQMRWYKQCVASDRSQQTQR